MRFSHKTNICFGIMFHCLIWDYKVAGSIPDEVTGFFN
jgi:hypothetical protein